MSSKDALTIHLNHKTFLGLRLWEVIAIFCAAALTLVLMILSIISLRRKSNCKSNPDKLPHTQIPDISKEITVDRVAGRTLAQSFSDHEGPVLERFSDNDSRKMLIHMATKFSDADTASQCSWALCEKTGSSYSGEEGSSNAKIASASSPLVGLPGLSHVGWGHWFTLRDLELATNCFSKENVIGEGGYGVVFCGRLTNGAEVAIKKILNNMGQAEKEFRVEVEAIGNVRHKNLVRLLGYCVEGIHRMLVYEYVNNGNLEQWLHGAMRQHGVLSWESRMKVILGTAKAGRVSDFGLANLLGSGKSHITTRVMGTFGYVAPEYANTGMLNEKSDVYNFGVLLLESVTGRDPVDYSRPANEIKSPFFQVMQVQVVEELIKNFCFRLIFKLHV